MADNTLKEYGIKYRVIKLPKKSYILFPVKLEEISTDENGFFSDQQPVPFLYDGSDLQHNRYVIDNCFALDELEYIYDYAGDEFFLSEYFFDDYKDVLIYIELGEDKTISKYNVNLSFLKDGKLDVSYLLDHNIPAIVLNENALNEIISAEDMSEAKVILEKYRRLIYSFKELSKKGITKVNVRNGKVSSFETSRKISVDRKKEREIDVEAPNVINKEVVESEDLSYQGLKKAIKEKVFGHDEEIDRFCQKLYMNYTALKGDPVESILLVGPTGTGKTETVKAACEYLDIPSYSVNASNIVPQGIKGMSIEDVIIGLLEAANYSEEKASRGLVFLDEFDKLNDSDLEIKGAVKNILLTFTAGGTFPIDSDRYTFTFDSSMVQKVYAGVFQDIIEKPRTLGFTSGEIKEILDTEESIREKIIEKGYFSQEELTRISTIIGFKDLDRDTKKRILLYSKLSEFAKKKERYKRQFGIDLYADDSYIEAILDTISNSATGMRSVNNYVKRTIDTAERELLDNEGDYKKLVLTSDTVTDPSKFDLI